MMEKRPVLAVVVFVSCLLLAGCSQRERAWEEARSANTPEAYERFLSAFPDGEFSSQARARAAELRETRDWEAAVAQNTLDAYREFVKAHPNGRMTDEARIRIESFLLTAQTAEVAGATAPGSASAPAGSAGAATPQPGSAAQPTSTQPSAGPQSSSSAQPSAAQSASATQTATNFRIQLGAFSGGEKQAMNEWRRLQADFPTLLQGLKPSVKLATTTSGHLYRLQAGFTDEARARAICAKLEAEGRDCVVVLP